MSWARAALGGLASGAWFGLLIGLLLSLFGSAGTSGTEIIIMGLLYGAAFGIVFGLTSYALTRGRRDFTSRSSLVAARYDVLCEAAVIGQARSVLGMGASWPPPLPVIDPAAAVPVPRPDDRTAGPQ
jgi:hypothetical protein